MRFEITRQSEDQLTKQAWVFVHMASSSDVPMVLDGYAVYSRPSTRHKFKDAGPNECYSRLSHEGGRMLENAVPLPDDVVAEVIDRVRALVSVRLWTRDCGGRW